MTIFDTNVDNYFGVEHQKQEDFYLENIIWLWEEYDKLARQIDKSPSESLNFRIQHLYEIDILSAYEDYYRYFGHHCTYQPKLSHLS